MDLETVKLSMILGFSIVLLHFSLLKKGEKSSVRAVAFIFIGSFLFIVTLSYLVWLYENSANKEKIKAFYDENSLICEAGAFQNKQHYIVSIKEDWSVYEENYFKKEGLLLEIINCEQKR